jgi:hypothetical protein
MFHRGPDFFNWSFDTPAQVDGFIVLIRHAVGAIGAVHFGYFLETVFVIFLSAPHHDQHICCVLFWRPEKVVIVAAKCRRQTVFFTQIF